MSTVSIPDVPLTPEGLDGVAWNVLGQVYLPKEIGTDRFVWYAIFPEETFVPPHTHAAQDEYLMPLDGPIDIVVGGRPGVVQPHEVGHLPRGIPHAFFNNSGKPVHALFWATPAGDLPTLYRRLHNIGSPARAVAIAPTCGVVFEPPVSSGA
ncbi:MAG: cupin domain-containing protein [Rubrivivax sp.]|jgi:mannose-6-phosphate isomerase-like protein (cupin superfamily)|nr:cupin domain-containing protein [Rubrivivax sp.]